MFFLKKSQCPSQSSSHLISSHHPFLFKNVNDMSLDIRIVIQSKQYNTIKEKKRKEKKRFPFSDT
jgi:hypothetical protein